MGISKEVLSGSTDGRMIEVAATSTPGTTIHTAHATAQDEVYLWAVNMSAGAESLTIEWGGTTSTDDLIQKTITAQDGLVLIVPGGILTNSLVVRAFSGSANVINIFGFVNRIT